MHRDRKTELLDEYSIEKEADEYLRSFLNMISKRLDSFLISTGFLPWINTLMEAFVMDN